jgi:hypothetical protein
MSSPATHLLSGGDPATMTGPLKNPRHEAFVRGLLEGKSALDAYEDAGYVADDANSCRLKSNPAVTARLAELQAEIASQTKVTTESLIGELEDARKRATDLEQLSAAVRSIEAKAKLAGLVTEKRQIEISGSVNFDNLTTPEQITRAMLDEVLRYSINDYHDFRPEDRDHLAGLFVANMQQMSDYIEAVKERPYRSSGTYQPPRTKALPSPYNGKSRR